MKKLIFLIGVAVLAASVYTFGQDLKLKTGQNKKLGFVQIARYCIQRKSLNLSGFLRFFLS